MYTICMKTEGYFTKEIKGDNEQDRLDKFETEVFEADFGELENICWDIDDANADFDEDFVDTPQAEKEGYELHKNLYTIYIEGNYTITLKNYDGTDINMIKTLAVDVWSEADFGSLDDCEERILWIEDENGNRIYQNI